MSKLMVESTLNNFLIIPIEYDCAWYDTIVDLTRMNELKILSPLLARKLVYLYDVKVIFFL